MEVEELVVTRREGPFERGEIVGIIKEDKNAGNGGNRDRYYLF